MMPERSRIKGFEGGKLLQALARAYRRSWLASQMSPHANQTALASGTKGPPVGNFQVPFGDFGWTLDEVRVRYLPFCRKIR